MSPFARPRVPELEPQTGLSERELLNFIDGLNEAFMANPALRATGQIGMMVGFVPLATTQIIGNSLEAAAGLAGAGVSAVRTKQYLKKVNQVTFGPRGFCARVVKTEKMLSLIGVGGSFSSDQYSALVGRHSSDVGSSTGGSGSRIYSPEQTVTQMQRPLEKRMALLGDRVMRLSFDNVASPAEANNWIKKWGTYSAQRAEQKQLQNLKEKEEKQSRKSDKAARKAGRKGRRADDKIADIMDEIDDLQCQIQGLDLSRRKGEKTERELRRDLRRLERKLAELEEDKEYDISRKSSRVHRKETRRNEKETKKINKLYWVVILPVDQNPPDEERDLESEEEEEQAVTDKASRI
ncbi:hypothetical protein N7499_000263 [Penicillium canescens]|uniref:uncharacterized protein n=1 Tax=Penicillium canescens TaxID=5083 RepID=UPI0026E00F57|nr:uncharacterized protein N7446_011537 [Penicillium canescens]KAJ6004193.1 hypothetical protein N7522_005838 [Penicillium canescens]KAJ6029118.1 hypothetical protein N7444_012105 [Penicillium canescens]KAJ6048854.1 hypothetical protein N7446_011537 [Penicillium canescens]KAJ6100633.1 hypothetical protein N7499_000263 [Penicillium canescens]KAJ6173094.1 hypothetical protein N7485_005906 [Penicillium canescens]